MKTSKELAREALSQMKPSNYVHYNSMTEDCFIEGFIAGYEAAENKKEEE